MFGAGLFGTSLLLGLGTVLLLGGDCFVQDKHDLLVGTDVLEETTGCPDCDLLDSGSSEAGKKDSV